MKFRFSSILVLALLMLTGCDDTTGTMGWDVMPVRDMLQAQTAKFEASSRSQRADSLYVRSEYAYLGKVTDPEFGSYESRVLSEFNNVADYKFPEPYKYDESTKTASGVLAGDSIVSCAILVFYDSWYGDSTSVARLNLYKLNETWINDRKAHGRFYRYTNLDTDKYYDKEDLISSVTFTPHDYSIPEDYRNKKDIWGQYVYQSHVEFPLSKEEGERILRLNREHPEYFKDNESFIKNVFPGVMIENEYGDGAVLSVRRIDFDFAMNMVAVDTLGVARKKKIDDETGKIGDDSIYLSSNVVFSTTNEVIQANKFFNSEILDEKCLEEESTYLKTPAGIFTVVTLPYDEIAQELAGDSINTVKLSLTSYKNITGYKYAMGHPSSILLVRQKDYRRFFEDNEMNDNKMTYISNWEEIETSKYVFANIARLVATVNAEKKQLIASKNGAWTPEDQEKWVKDNELLLIPVSLGYDNDSETVINVQHDLSPTYAKIVGGPAKDASGKLKNPIVLEVNYTTFAGK